MTDELNEAIIERALRRAFGHLAGYGSTAFRGPINPGTIGSGQTVLEWPGECSPARRPTSEPIIIQTDYDVQDAPGGPFPTDTIEAAFLQFDWGEVGHSVQVDLVRGFSVSLSGSRAAVRIFYPRDPSPLVTQPSIMLRVTVGVGGSNSAPGTTGSARKTILYGTVPPVLQTAVQPIPPWATTALFQNPSAGNGTLVFRQFLDAIGNITVSEVDLGKLNGVSVDIAQGARFAAFFNPGAVAVLNTRVVYHLGIGA